jgi:hypothetical protein
MSGDRVGQYLVFMPGQRAPGSAMKFAREQDAASFLRELLRDAIARDHLRDLLRTLKPVDMMSEPALIAWLAPRLASGEFSVIRASTRSRPSVQQMPLVRVEKTKPKVKPPEKKTVTHWLEFRLQDKFQSPIIYADCRVQLSDGSEVSARTNEFGAFRLDGLAKADVYKLRFPDAEKKNQKKPKTITIKKVDAHFASGAEHLCLEYQTTGVVAAKLYLEVTSDNYPGGPIYKRLIGYNDKTDGDHLIWWDGQANCKSGDLKDGKFITPLLSPYKIRIYEEGGPSDDSTFNVLYHSIKLQQGPWSADELAPTDETEWVRYRLNELGYHAGLSNTEIDDCFKKAIVGYRHNHPELWQLDPDNYKAEVTADLKQALIGDAGRRPLFFEPGDKGKDPTDFKDETGLDAALKRLNSDGYLEPAALGDPQKTTEILVEAPRFDKRGGVKKGGRTAREDEFLKDKSVTERKRMNRPMLPIEAVVFLKGKGGDAIDCPKAVGAIRVNWRFEEPSEDLSKQFGFDEDAPSFTKLYLSKALKVAQAGKGENGNNCPIRFGGIRDVAAKNYYAPVVLGDAFVPHKVLQDKGQKLVHSQACIDQDKYPLRLGRAGFLFRPSLVAGDAYRIIAEIDFKGQDNQEKLEELHGVNADPKSRIQFSSGTLRIVRWMRTAMKINWPRRKEALGANKIAAEFLPAYLRLFTSKYSEAPITGILSQKDYVDVVTKHTPNRDPKKIRLTDDHLLGIDLPKQGDSRMRHYRNLLKTFAYDNFLRKVDVPLRRAISEVARKKCSPHTANGLVVVPYLLHPPVKVMCGDTVAFPNYIAESYSRGMPDSVVLYDQDDDSKSDYVIAHEIGHCLWLRHSKLEGEPNPKHHDQDDFNCIMSYFDLNPALHFCGKCNLRLRGWNVFELPQKMTDDAGWEKEAAASPATKAQQ